MRTRGRAGVEAGMRLSREAGRFLALGDEAGLRCYLRTNCSNYELVEQLGHPEAEVVRVAVICLGLSGRFEHTEALAGVLHHDDYFVVSAAERALRHIGRQLRP